MSVTQWSLPIQKPMPTQPNRTQFKIRPFPDPMRRFSRLSEATGQLKTKAADPDPAQDFALDYEADRPKTYEVIVTATDPQTRSGAFGFDRLNPRSHHRHER